jgi:hypothetical protein
VGTPTAGAFDRPDKEPDFKALILFTGALLSGGGVILLLVRLLHRKDSKAEVRGAL